MLPLAPHERHEYSRSLVNRSATVVYIATSLDGFIARTDGSIDWLVHPEPPEDFGWAAFLATLGGIVMGRATFEHVLTFPGWPYGEIPMTVLTRAGITVPAELAHTVRASSRAPREVLVEMRERGCERIYVDGGKTIQAFLAEDLIDELIITTLPVLIGSGLSLFGPLERDLAFAHLSTRTLPLGLVQSSYRRIR